MYISGVNCTHWGISDVVTKSFNGTCFGFLRSTRSWTSARTFCEQRNSSLVKFDSTAKLNAIKQWIFGELGQTAVWTAGYRRTQGSSNWFWSTLHGGGWKLCYGNFMRRKELQVWMPKSFSFRCGFTAHIKLLLFMKMIIGIK